MKNKKAFTLIELLAVIVVLAIIALIATPIVMKTIKNAKKGAAERSADSYIKQVEVAVATSKLDGNEVQDGTYEIDGEGNLTVPSLKDGKLKIEMSGSRPKGGEVTITNGQATLTSPTEIDGLDVSYDSTNKKYVASEKGSTPSVEALCKANTAKVTAIVYNGSGDPGQESSYTSEEVGLLSSEATSKYDAGVTYTCELGDGEQNTFYVLETNGDNVSLIAGVNLGSTVAWCDDETECKTDGDWDNTKEAFTAKVALKERTTGWTKLNQSQIMLPTKDQITGTYAGSMPTWLYGNLKSDTWVVAYWTSTPDAGQSNFAWMVDGTGILANDTIDLSTFAGIRPVITISKSQLG